MTHRISSTRNWLSDHLNHSSMHQVQRGSSAKRLHLLIVMIVMSCFSLNANAQVSAPPNINGGFPVGVNNLDGTADGTQGDGTLGGLGLQNGVTFDLDATLSGTATWNNGLGFNNASEINVQADNTNSPANSASYVFTFSETVYGFQVEKDGLDNDDRTVITFFNNGVQVPVDLSVVVDLGTNVNTTLISGAIEAIGPGNDNDEEFITINLPLTTAIDEVRFEPSHKDDIGNNGLVTLQYRDFAWATPDVALTKSSTLTGAPTSVGDIIEYTYVVTNNGQVPLTNVGITETGFTGTGTTPTPAFDSGTGGATPANLPQGETLTFIATYAITADDIAAGSVDNQGTVSALPIGGTVGIDEVTDLSDSSNPGDGGAAGALDEDDPTSTTVPAPPVADVSATLGAIPAVVSPGQVLTGLTLTCSNNGPDTAVNAICAPTADVGAISALSCTPATPADIDSGDDIVCTFNYTAPGTAGGSDTGPSAINIAGATGADNDVTPTNNADADSADIIDAVNDSTTDTFGTTSNTFDLSTNDQIPAGATFSIAPGSTCDNPSVSGAGVATFDASPGTSCVVEYQVCGAAPNTAVCDTATLSVSLASALPAFACDGTTYQVFGTPANVAVVDLINGEADIIGTLPTGVNSTGFNMNDGFAYGLFGNELVRIGSNGVSENLGEITGLPSSFNSNRGDFGPDGFLYVGGVNSNNFQVVDVENIAVVAVVPWTMALGNVPDVAFIPSENALFGVDVTNDNLNRIELDGTVTVIGSIGVNQTFGAMYGDAAGNLFGIANGTGVHFQFDITTGAASVIGSSAPASANDGFSCPGAVLDIPQADLVTVKTLASGNATPGEGDTVTFEIAVTNNGPAIASDTTLTDLLPAGLTATGNNGTTAAGSYSAATGLWDIGTINQGDTVTLTLEGTVDAGQTGNTIQNITTTADANQEDPTTDGDDLEESVVVGAADVSATFGAIPAVISPGQVLTTLELTCTNIGTAAATNADCVPTVDEGTISNLVCTPATPVNVDGGDSIVCTFDYTAPGTAGGSDTTPVAVEFTGTASADNDDTPANNVDTANADLIDALDDSTSESSGSTGNTFDLSTNDEVPIDSVFSIAPGSSCANSSVDTDGVATFDATPGPTCTVEYQVCAPAPNETVCDTASLTVTGEDSDVSATFGPIPTVVSPGQLLEDLTLTCANAGPGTAINADCVPTVDVGTISNLICVPTTPADINSSDDISCVFDYTAPGTAGGSDTTPTAVEFIGTASADNDNTPANNVDTENSTLIDALDDAASAPGGSTGNTSDLSTNDDVPTGSVFSVAPGSSCANSSVDSAGLATFDATPAPTCTVNYQVCAPTPNETVCDTATLTVTAEIADVSATFGPIPTVVSPGQLINGLTLTCDNSGPSTAINADCVPTVDEGTISNLVCAPITPADVANGDSIACTFDYTAPGTAGGLDTVPTGVEFTGTASADNDNTPANNVDTENVEIIDAISDVATPPGGSTGNTFDLSTNDELPPGSVFSIAPGSSCENSSVDTDGVATFDAVPGPSCTVEYQVCAPAPNETVCDTATLTVTGELADVSATFGPIPSVISPGQVLNALELTCTNAGPSDAINANCLPTVDEGLVDNVVCTPTTPATVASGDSISCTFDYSAPGASGGSDTTPTAVTFTGSASADNDNTPANNVDTENAELIDALDDIATPPGGSTGNTLDLGDNDQVPPGSVFSILPGGTCENSSVDAAGVATFDAIPGPTCTVEYQVCAPTPNETVCDTATLTVTGGIADVSATFGPIPSVVNPGQFINALELTCANAGPSTAINADCIPTVDEGSISNLVCSPPTPTSVASGDSISCTFDYAAPGAAGGSDTAPTAVVFTGTASADNDNTPANNVDIENSELIDAVDDVATPPGGSTGNTLDLGDNDQVPPGSVFTIAPGGTCENSSVDMAGVATFDAVPGPTCTVEYQVCAPAPNETVCDTATLTVTGGLADVSATFGPIPTVFSPGQVLGALELTCANAGPSAAINADCVPTVDEGSIDNLVCTPATPTSVASGDSISCTFDYTAPGTLGGSDTVPTVVVFTGTASADNDNTPANNVDTENTELIDALDDIATPPGGSTSNTLDLGGNDQVPPGSVFSILPGGTCENSSVDAAGSATFDAVPGPSCTVAYQVCAPTPNETVCDTATLTVTGDPADLSATFGPIPTVVSPGQVLNTLELTCVNAGPSAAINADCVPTVDEGSIDNLVCAPATPTTVASGDGISCTFDYAAPGTAGGSDTAPLSVEFTGAASADNDGTPANNVDTENVALIDALDDIATPPGGSTGNTLDLADNDQVPPGSVFSIAPGSTCENASVDNDGLATFDAVPGPTCIVEYQVCAPTPNETVCDTATLTVDAPLATLEITKEIVSINDDSDGVSEGDQINYQITATNSGNTVLTNVVVSDPLITPDSFVCDTLVAGDTCVLNGLYIVTAADAAAGVVLNIASVTSTEVPGPVESPEISVTIDPLPAALSGFVFLDENVNDVFDGGELPLVDWIIEVILDGTVVGTTNAASDGSYSFVDLVPSDNYEIQLRHPDTNIAFGLLDDVELVSGQNLIDQNIPVDPSGVVYDSVSRAPIEGVQATIVNAVGTPLPDACLLPDQQDQVTADDGFYRFDLVLDADPACPSGGTFSLEFVAPTGFNDAPSTSILPEAGAFDPTGLGDPVQIQPQGTPPAVGEDTTYFLSFEIENGDPDVIFNHVPLDPQGLTDLQLTKTAGSRTANIGELVSYQVAIENTGANDLVGLTLVDTPPAGFRFVEGSQTINIEGLTLTATGDRPFTIGGINLAAGETAIVGYFLRVGAGITRGEYVNTVGAELGGASIGNTATASVEIVSDPDFEETTIIGKVFDDQNENGWQDEGELGIPGIRLATVTGLLIETDSEGRYHIAGVDVERFERGRNFLLKLDAATLPDGAVVVTENPRVMRITQGLLNQINFGVKLPVQEESVEVEIGELLFIKDAVDIREEHQPLLDQMAEHVREYKGGVLTIVGRAGTEALAIQRAELLRNELVSRLDGYPYPVDINVRTESSPHPLATVGYEMKINAEFFFETFKYDISEEQRPALEQLAEQLKNTCASDVLIEGHTDIRNKSGINNELSKNRARIIYEALVELGAFSKAGEICAEPVNTPASDKQSKAEPSSKPANDLLKSVLAATLSFFIAPAYAEEIDISKADINQDLCSVQHCETDEGVVVKILGRAATQERTPGYAADQLKDNRRTDVMATVAADGRDLSTISGLMFTRLATGGTLWLTEDPLVVEPKFAFSTPYGVKKLGQTDVEAMRFEFYTNYAAFQDRLELLIYEFADQDRVSPVATLSAEPDMFGEFVWQPEEPVSPGDRFFAYINVYNEDGLLDFTTSRDFEVFDYDSLTTAEKESHEEERPYVSVYGRTDLAEQRMPLHGSLVRVHGDVKGQNPALRINDQFVPVDAENEFAVEYLVPVGQHAFDIEVTPEGAEPQSRQLAADVSGEYMFITALADITASTNDISGSVEPLTAGDDRFEEDFLVDGRLAFYLKGKIKGKYLLTAQLDTQEDELGEVFSNFFDKDPDSVFRRLDPDLYYPVYGDDSTTISDTDSQGNFYLRLDWNQSQALWGNYHTGLNGTEFAQYNRSLYGAKVEYNAIKATDLGESKTHGKVFVSETQTAFGHAEFLGTGGSLYYLPNTDILPGSEKVSIEIRDRDSNLVVDTVILQRDQDYEVDEIQGRIILARPLAQIQTRRQSIVRDDPLDGDTSILLVDYEYVPDNFDADSVTVGARGKHWITDNIAVGGTYVQEGRGNEDYQLAGADVTLQAGLGTYINLEVAQSEASQANGFFSDNGGLSFQQIAETSELDREGEALGVTARANLQESGITNSAWEVGAWWRNTEEGFSTARRDLGEELTEQGVEVQGEITDKLSLGVRATSVELGEDVEDEQVAVMVSYSLRDNDELSAEIRRIRERNLLNPDTVSATLAALRYTYALNNFVDLYGQVQFTVDDDDGAYESNDLVSFGLRTRISDKTTINSELTSGDRGEGALIGFDYIRSERHSIYGSYTLSTDRTETLTSGERVTIGNRWKVSNQTSLFAENQFVESRTGAGIAHAFGIDYEPFVGFTLGATFQTGELEAFTGLVDRDAITFAAGVTRDAWQWRSALEFRSDSGAEEVTQWLTTNRVNFKINDSFQLLGRLNFSDTDDELSVIGDATFTEAGIGFAYRPTDDDRWNLLGRYTFLYDLNSLGQIGAGTDQRSNILSVEGIYRATPRWKFGGKLARRQSDLRVGRSEGEFFESTANFAALRARYHLISSWDGLLEYRFLDITEDDSLRSGVLVGIDRHFGNNFKLGVGYNFTDFSDDLTILDFDQQGFFINAVGKY